MLVILWELLIILQTVLIILEIAHVVEVLVTQAKCVTCVAMAGCYLMMALVDVIIILIKFFYQEIKFLFHCSWF